MAQIFKFPVCRVVNVSSINPESLIRDLLDSSEDELSRTFQDLLPTEKEKVFHMVDNGMRRMEDRVMCLQIDLLNLKHIRSRFYF